MIAYPPLSGKGSPMLTQNRQFQWMHQGSYIFPIVPATAITLLRQEGCDVVWADAITKEMDRAAFDELFTREKPDIIAIETKTPVVRQHWKIVEELKAIHPDCTFVLMGDHVTALPEETMRESQTDFVITGGDFDVMLLGLVRHIDDGTPLPPGFWYRKEGKIKSTGKFKLEHNLNDLPFIDRKLTHARLYGEKWKKFEPFYYTMAGRDCFWGKCRFCSWTTIFPQFRVRKPESLLDEIGMLIEDEGAKEIFDDSGTFPVGGWLKTFCKGMIDRGYNKKVPISSNMRFGVLDAEMTKLMKKAGWRKVKMGLESANQVTLDRLDKGIKVQDIVDGAKWISQAGIDIHLTVMVGFPWETRADAENTLGLARMLMNRGWAEMLQSTVLVPYPGTPLYTEGLEKDWFRFDPAAYERYDMTEPALKMPDMTPEDVVEICQKIYKSFLSPSYVLRRLGRVRSWNDVNYVMRGAKAVVNHILDFKKGRDESKEPTGCSPSKK